MAKISPNREQKKLNEQTIFLTTQHGTCETNQRHSPRRPPSTIPSVMTAHSSTVTTIIIRYPSSAVSGGGGGGGERGGERGGGGGRPSLPSIRHRLVKTTAHHNRHHCCPLLTIVAGGGGRPGRSSPPLMTTVLLNCHCRHPQSPPSPGVGGAPTSSLPRKAATVSAACAVRGGEFIVRSSLH